MTVLAADLGGTRIKLGVVRDGVLLAQGSCPARARKGLARQLPVLRSAWLDLLTQAGVGIGDCAGMALAFPSVVERGTGRILDAYGKYRDAPGLDLAGWAKDAFGLPLAIENDARMALLGEWRHGAGRGCDNVVMVTLGTGIGTAAVLEGRLIQGCHGQGGILGGHMTVRHYGERCVCGNLGCAEAEASTVALSGLAARLPSFDFSPLRKAATLNYAIVFKLAAAGDPCAVALRDHSLWVWGAMAVSLIHAYDPERLILGGGIMASADVVLPAVSDFVRRHAHTPWGQVQVMQGQLGDRAALLAAEPLVRERIRQGVP
ncbi:MAG: ROK family protein [Verrucomicrobiae bacterium]|nr:ROK family protein [Verrucomicrobiae bacterium]